MEKVRDIVTWFMNIFGILNVCKAITYRKPYGIRVINYHRTPENELETFEKQLDYFSKHFRDVDFKNFELYKKGELVLDKPGIMCTFDDGLLNNYECALPLLEKYGFTGYFFVSSEKVGKTIDEDSYMSFDQLREVIERGHVVGCHTATHHRMAESDTEEILKYEIVDSKQKLESELGDIDIFCWCGGEENTYTQKAQDVIKNNYNYGFMTNNELVYPDTDNHHIQRSNVEARFTLTTAKFQICGILDKLYEKKRNAVNNKTI